MTDQVLNILKFVLLGLLYLFFARVLWAVWSEVRAPGASSVRFHKPASSNGQGGHVVVPAGAATTPMVRPGQPAPPSKADTKRSKKAARSEGQAGSRRHGSSCSNHRSVAA